MAEGSSSSEELTEKRNITWLIEEYDKVHTSDSQIRDQTYVFEMGNTIGLPTEWCFFLKPCEDYIGVFLKLLKKPDDVTEMKFSFSIGIKNTCTWVYTQEGPLHDWETEWGNEHAISKHQKLEELPLTDGFLVINLFIKLSAPKIS